MCIWVTSLYQDFPYFILALCLVFQMTPMAIHLTYLCGCCRGFRIETGCCRISGSRICLYMKSPYHWFHLTKCWSMILDDIFLFVSLFVPSGVVGPYRVLENERGLWSQLSARHVSSPLYYLSNPTFSDTKWTQTPLDVFHCFPWYMKGKVF